MAFDKYWIHEYTKLSLPFLSRAVYFGMEFIKILFKNQNLKDPLGLVI